jgi:glycosyltransferase involved in cell wall biosynthesis
MLCLLKKEQTMKVSIVLLPKMNLLQLVKLLAQIQQLQLAHEIIVVNDGSTDQTKQVAETAGAK